MRTASLVVFAIMFGMGSLAAAGELNKEQCVEAHSRAQDVREQGKLSLAHKLFLMCAQPSCPTLIQNDCARFADDLARLQPTVSFLARDGSGADLPDTTVYVDDVLIVNRLDDGRPHDIDPGKHVIRFANNGHERVETIVIGSGEQGRTVVATFGSPAHVVPTTASIQPSTHMMPARTTEPTTTHPTGARAIAIGGITFALAGTAFGIFELTRLPAGCSLSSHQCSAAPGDPVFEDAQRATHLANLGWAGAAVGLAAATGAVIWYVTGAKTTKERLAVAPWLAPGAGGFAVAGSL